MDTTTLRLGKPKAADDNTIVIASDRSTLDVIAELAKALGDSPRMLGLARAVARGLVVSRGDDEREAKVLAALMPRPSTLSEPAVRQLQWNVAAREEALAEFGALTSRELASLRGSATSNPHTTSSRWLDGARIFAIDTAEGRMFPAFQFEHGQPRPVMARVIEAIDGELDDWGLLLWFTGSSGYLDGRRPVDLLLTKPDEVVAAARYQSSLSDD